MVVQEGKQDHRTRQGTTKYILYRNCRRLPYLSVLWRLHLGAISSLSGGHDAAM